MEKVIPNLFTEDHYDTPEGKRRAFGDRLFGGWRLYFYWCNFMIFVRSGLCGKRGELDASEQTRYSNMNIDLVEKCGGKIHLRGLNHVDELGGRPAVFIGNHMSLLETALFHAILRPRVDFTFVIKESLLEVPFFKHIMRSLGAIPVTRRNPKEDFKQVMERGKATLEAGRSIILFPQHTRSVEFKPEEFNSIGVKLARAAGVEVVPFALKTDFLSNGRLLKDMGPLNRSEEIYFEFGEPFRVNGNGREELRKIVEFIQSRLKEWRNGQ